MNNYFKERMVEIQLRSEQMEEKKKYELEIRSLEVKLRGLENDYDRLQTTYKSNFEQSALKKVDLAVAKEAHEFLEAMLDKNRNLLVEEKGKLDDLHWQIFKEERSICEEIEKCVTDNDTVKFLNEYPLVLKTSKYTSRNTAKEYDETIKKAVADHPEIKQLTAEVAALEIEIKKVEDNCLSGELRKVLTEIEELNSNSVDKSDEIQRLIEALERSHRERMAIEAEIKEIENLKIEAPCFEAQLKMNEKDLKDILGIRNEPKYISNENLENAENWLENKLETYHNEQVIKKKDKKLKAKKWYQEYTRSLATIDAVNDFINLNLTSANSCDVSSIFGQRSVVQNTPREGCFFSSETEPPPRKNKLLNFLKEDEVREEDENVSVKIVETFAESSQPVKSRFFEKNVKKFNSGPGFLPVLKPKRNLAVKKEPVDVEAGSPGATPKPKRMFEPLMATPNTFFNFAAETASDKNSAQSSHGQTPTTSNHGIRRVKKTAKFTLKRPSNIGKKSLYRQTRLDDFDNFMLSDNCTQFKGSKI